MQNIKNSVFISLVKDNKTLFISCIPFPKNITHEVFQMINYCLVLKISHWLHLIPVNTVSMFIWCFDKSSFKNYENTLSSLEKYGNLKNIENVNNIRRDIVNDP